MLTWYHATRAAYRTGGVARPGALPPHIKSCPAISTGDFVTLLTRRTLLEGLAATAALPALGTGPTHASDTIPVGAIYDLSGPLQGFGQNQWRCARLALDQINESGGLLGRPLDVKLYDSQSDMQFYNQFANQLALRDRVAVVQGGLTSSSREVIRPILRRLETLYVYNTNYEGGVCDGNFFATGATPGIYVDLLLRAAAERWGKRVYVLAADYNYGQISAQWIRRGALALGGEVVGEEFFPLEVNQFGATISRIQAVEPDVVLNVFVGPAHEAFYGQWASAGMNQRIPMMSTTFGGTSEIVRMPPEVVNGIMVIGSYYESLDYPFNRTWLAEFRRRNGTDYGYLTDVPIKDWYGWMLWAEGVRQAGTTDREAVVAALETGISVEGPGGPLTIDTRTHHCFMNTHLAEARDGEFRILERYQNVPPTNPADQCDLQARPDTNTMYTPDI